MLTQLSSRGGRRNKVPHCCGACGKRCRASVGAEYGIAGGVDTHLNHRNGRRRHFSPGPICPGEYRLDIADVAFCPHLSG